MVVVYELDGLILIPCSARFFLFLTAFRLTLGPTQPHIQWIPGVPCLVINWQERETDHSYSSSVEVKKGGAIPPLSHIFMA
jgi:hypothetical protein